MPVTINGTTGIAGVDGSASTPAVQGSDTNTGVFYPAADTVGVSTGGSERMRVDSSGNVGIGTNSPQAKLHINSGAGSTQFRMGPNSTSSDRALINYNSTTNRFAIDMSGNDALVVDGSSNVGIGTSSPSTFGNFAVQTSSGNTPTIAVTANALSPQLNHYITDSSSTIRNLNQITFWTGSSTNTNYQGYMTFSTMASAGGTISERMRIDATGCVLVNGTTPASVEKFNITHNGASNEGMIIVNTNSSAGTHTGIGFRRPSGTTVGTITTTTSTTAYNTSSDYRLKNSVAPLSSGLSTISALKPVSYKWNVDDSVGEGFIAHELAEHIPLAVVGEKDAVDSDGKPIHQGVDYSKIVVHLVAAIQELSAKVDAQAAEIATLKANAPA